MFSHWFTTACMAGCNHDCMCAATTALCKNIVYNFLFIHTLVFLMHYTIRHTWFLEALYGCLQLQLYKENFVLKIDTSHAWFLDASQDCHPLQLFFDDFVLEN